MFAVVRGCCTPDLYCSRDGAQFCPVCMTAIEFPPERRLSAEEVEKLFESNGQFAHRLYRIRAICVQWRSPNRELEFSVADLISHVARHNKWGMDCPEVRFLVDTLNRCPHIFGPLRDGVQMISWLRFASFYRD